MRHYLFVLLLLLIIGCGQKNRKQPTHWSRYEMRHPIIEDTVTDSGLSIEEYTDTIETYIDSLKFGVKRKTKLELLRICTNGDFIAKIKLYQANGSRWTLRDTLDVPATGLRELSPFFSDFNSDGYSDLLFISNEAARGANTMQTLVLYDHRNQRLIRIRNSENYPNLEYNKKLKCIDALIFTGGMTTSFLRIEKDSLIEFANVDLFNKYITVTTIDQSGKRKIIEQVKNRFTGFERFSNYNPLKVNSLAE